MEMNFKNDFQQFSTECQILTIAIIVLFFIGIIMSSIVGIFRFYCDEHDYNLGSWFDSDE